MRLVPRIALLAPLVVASCANAQPGNALVLGERGQACGVLTVEKHFGPPNFGENPSTDTIFSALVLKTATPVALHDPKRPGRARQTDRIQLYFKTGKSNDGEGRALVGKHLCVSGASSEAITPSDIAPVNISVEEIDAASSEPG